MWKLSEKQVIEFVVVDAKWLAAWLEKTISENCYYCAAEYVGKHYSDLKVQFLYDVTVYGRKTMKYRFCVLLARSEVQQVAVPELTTLLKCRMAFLFANFLQQMINYDTNLYMSDKFAGSFMPAYVNPAFLSNVY